MSCDVDTAVSSRASMLGLTSSRLLSPTQYRALAGSLDLERASRGAILRWDRRRTIGGRGVKGPSVQKWKRRVLTNRLSLYSFYTGTEV